MLNQYFVALLVTAITHFTLAIFVYLKGPRKLTNVTYALYSAAIAWWSGLEAFSITTLSQTHALFLWRLNHVGVIFVPIFFVHFVMSLLEDHEHQRRKYLVRFSYAAGVALILLNATPLFIREVVPKFSFRHFINPGLLYPFFFVGWVGWAVYGLFLLFRVYARSKGLRRNQLRYFCWAMLVAYIGGAPNFLPTFNIEIPFLMPFGTYAIAAYAFFTTYAIVRYRLMDANVALINMALVAIIYVPLLILPALLGSLFQPRLVALLGSSWWLLPMAFEALFAVGGLAVYQFVQKKAEKRLLREQDEILETLRRASRDMTQYHKMRDLVRIMTSVLTGKMGVSHVALYLLDEEGRRYHLMSSRGYNPHVPEMKVGKEDPLIQYLQAHKNTVVREEILLQDHRRTSLDLKAVAAQLHQLEAECAIPSFARGHLLGFVLLGAKQSGRMYTTADLETLMTLANQAALAIENARFYEAEEKRQAQIAETAKLTSLGVMASSIGHQFNNRFFMQVATATVLRDLLKQLQDLPGLPEEMVPKMIERAEKIIENALQGGKIAEIIKDFAKPGKAGARFPLSTVLNTATDFARSVGKLEGFDFDISLPDDLPFIRGNESQLADSFFNLISNASDAIKSKERAIQQGGSTLPAGGLPFRGKLQIKVVSFDEKGAPWLKIEVSDNGVGIQEEEFPNLFVPFFTTKDNLGTGLGLFTVKWFIERHEGTVEVNSVYGKGTTFTIRLPGVKPEPKA